MAFDYDLFVIGGGSGGVRAARIAAAEGGASVALAEEDRMGGTCVIRGCVPKKLMVFAADFPTSMADARAYGWQVDAGAFDWPGFRTAMHGELARLEGIYRANLERAGVSTYDARATIEDAHTVALSDGRRFRARHLLVATGGRPWVPEVDAAAGVMTSDDVFHLEALPRSLLVVGGGYIASEFSCIFNGLGVEVTQFYRGEQILRGFDGETRAHVAGAMRARGVGLEVGTDVAMIEPVADGFRVTDTQGRARVFEQVLYATGRTPNTDGLGLEAAGVTLGARGAVPVDAYSQTAVPSIYAVGDATDRVNLTPVAIREGEAFARTVFCATPRTVDHTLVASAVFTRPELGSVGLSEEAAAARESVEIYGASFRPMHSAFAGRDDRAMMKLVVSCATGRVLGCHIVADGAGELIQLAAIALGMGATKEDFDRTMAVHPTMAEELVTMKVPIRST